MQKMDLAQARQRIVESKNIVICGHINPDGDCIGSLLALGLGLSVIGKRIQMVLQDSVPKRYRELPGVDRIKKRVKKAIDLAITVDCNAQEMVGRPFAAIKKAKDILEIDHHAYRKSFGSFFLIDTKAAAVGEIVYQLLKYLNIKISKDIARNILTSIIVETNSFRLPTVRPFTFRVSSELLKAKVDYHKLSELVYWSKTKPAALLSGICMSKITFLKKGKIAWSMVTRRDFRRVQGKDEDVDSVAGDLLSINTVRIAIFFREKDNNQLRVSLRSKGGINVAFLANKYGGGGHFDSAGCRIPNKKKIMTEFIKESERLL